jgi:Flp pilus assembly protein TadG
MRRLVPHIDRLRRFARDARGAAGVEFSLWLLALAVPIFSVFDLSFYVQQRMQVQNAAQASAQFAWASCSSSTTWRSAIGNCGNTLTDAITKGAHSTTLGSSVTVLDGADSYYCLDSSGTLTLVGTAGTIAATGSSTAPTKPSPFTCASVVSGSTTLPSEYIIVNVSRSYSPLFKGVSVVSLLGGTITASSWTRLN